MLCEVKLWCASCGAKWIMEVNKKDIEDLTVWEECRECGMEDWHEVIDDKREWTTVCYPELKIGK